jgi:hypothetical protein
MIPLFLLTVHYVDFKIFVLSIIRGTLHPPGGYSKKSPSVAIFRSAVLIAGLAVMA